MFLYICQKQVLLLLVSTTIKT